MYDPVTGTMRKLWCLVVTLSFSRMTFAWPTFDQTTTGGDVRGRSRRIRARAPRSAVISCAVTR
jgi:hypothetical protein